MFVDNLDAFTKAFGVEHAPSIIAFAQVPWPSVDERNDFIFQLTGVSIKARNSYV